jgi:hypothetical protein
MNDPMRRRLDGEAAAAPIRENIRNNTRLWHSSRMTTVTDEIREGLSLFGEARFSASKFCLDIY